MVISLPLISVIDLRTVHDTIIGMDWAFVLVIILSIFLALFLLLGIILVILLIRVTLQIKSVTESAQRTASSIENTVAGVSKFASPAVLLGTLFGKVKGAKRKKKE